MTTEDALLAAILANPADDLCRLVYADWLDERNGPGDRERAEFIRVQVELTKVPGYPKSWDGEKYPHVPDLHRRQVWLLNEWDYRRGWRHLAGREAVRLIPDGEPWYDHMTFSRGFVSEVRCTLADWCGGECGRCQNVRLPGEPYTTQPHPSEFRRVPCPACAGTGRTPGIGPEVVRRHPVERVVLTDRVPIPTVQGGYSWAFGTSGGLPEFLSPRYDRANRYQMVVSDPLGTRDEAVSWASDQLILWAKSQPHPARLTTSPVSADLTRHV